MEGKGRSPHSQGKPTDEIPKRPGDLSLEKLSLGQSSPHPPGHQPSRQDGKGAVAASNPVSSALAQKRALPELRPLERTRYNETGREFTAKINAWPIVQLPTRTVYQYEVNAVSASGLEYDKRILRAAFNCDARKTQLPHAIWDGGNIAWDVTNLPNGIQAKVPNARRHMRRQDGSHDDGQDNWVQFSMIKRRELDLTVIRAWLSKRHAYDQYVMEALNFLDHLIRDYPASQHAATKRAYFFENLHHKPGFEDAERQQMSILGNSGATVYRGIFQTIRPSLHGLYLNVDAAYGVFYSRGSLLNIVKSLLNCTSQGEVWKKLAPIRHQNTAKESVEFLRLDKRIKGIMVMPNYEGCPFQYKSFRIANLINGGANEYYINIQDKATGITNRCTIQQYFRQKYNLELEYPSLPLVQMENRAVIYPMELLVIKGLQRWPKRLTDMQSRMMIQFAAAKPELRMKAIQLGKSIMDHENDPVLKKYGFKLGDKMIETKARLLPNPEIMFGDNRKHNPGNLGRWDLRGRKFLRPNKDMLQAWGVGYFSNHRDGINHMQLERFVDSFAKIYKQHGGLVRNLPRTVALVEDIAEAVLKLYNDVRTSFNREPQMLIFIVATKDASVYTRIKKSCDCRFGVPSQVLLAAHCINNRPQYHSNVLMKVNAKLGGLTAQAVPTSKRTMLRPRTVIIGADVTHPMMGVFTPSLAALSLSNDANGISYMGNCQVNGAQPMKTKEIIEEDVMRDILMPLMREWIKTHNGVPENIYYLRDGVSESEYRNILNEEVHYLRDIMDHASGAKARGTSWPGKITVVIANKRHHLRAWPNPKDTKSADRNGNPHPGTLIDRTVVGLHGWDFLLYAHTALQGTARPVHYKVVLDEIGHQPEELENMIYEHSYQYLRSTTSVSIHPAIYYAHLISVRARHHEDVPASQGPSTGRDIKMVRWPQLKDLQEKQDRTPEEEETLRKAMPKSRLLNIKDSENRLMYKMWWM